MKTRNVAEYCKNAVGTMFLLAGAFFVCSTLLSMRSVLADPVAPVVNNAASAASPRSAGTSRRATANTVSRGTASRVVAAPRAATTTSRAVTSRPAAAAKPVRSISLRSLAAGVRRSAANNASRATTNTTQRAVRARTATAPTVAKTADVKSRVSLQGTAIRGSKASTSSSYTYLSSKLYTGNYSNIIDSSTGLISADAYSNCLDSYYTCMDEICTARNASQGRCACAARTKAFQNAEAALETANEELIKVSGELALLVATKGKDVSAAFQLTDAEKVMNCVSWQEMSNQYGTTSTEAVEWCNNHGIYTSTSSCDKPSYCSSAGNSFDFDISDIEGSSSDILASLKAWADAKDDAAKMLVSDDDDLLNISATMNEIVGNVSGITSTTAETTLDNLANTWGYELFEYAHNNICSRVLDSCFNGIYEGCGTPPTNGRCADGSTTSCPFNYNSKIAVDSAGDVTLNERGSSTTTAASSATCFGYTSTTGDPYSSLRGPVADARRSVMQKYLLDANAACDVYGDQLRATAQNIGYQKVAAQQALQQKRMEFANEERETVLNDAVAASTNFNECLSDLLDCYEEQKKSNSNWSTARIKTYCAQVAEVPSCYETMICNPSNSPFKAVIDKTDLAECKNTADYTTNTCRNIVTLNDIINKATTADVTDYTCEFGEGKTCDSAKMREACMQKAFVQEIRDWKKDSDTENAQ